MFIEIIDLDVWTCIRYHFVVMLFSTGRMNFSVGGLDFYLIELVVPVLFLLPHAVISKLVKSIYVDTRQDVHIAKVQAAKGLIKKKAIHEIRTDSLWVLLFFGFSGYLYAGHMALFAAILICRGLFISFMDNIYHYATPIVPHSVAHNIKVPKLVQKMILNANFHGFHHHYPKVPWYNLPQEFEKHQYNCKIDLKEASLRQFQGAVEDEALGLNALIR